MCFPRHQTVQSSLNSSGKGSDLLRSHLYAHALVTICPHKPAKTEIIGKLKNAGQNSRTHTYYKRDDQTGQKIEINLDLPSLKALGKDGLCRLLFYETRLLYQLLTANLAK